MTSQKAQMPICQVYVGKVADCNNLKPEWKVIDFGWFSNNSVHNFAEIPCQSATQAHQEKNTNYCTIDDRELDFKLESQFRWSTSWITSRCQKLAINLALTMTTQVKKVSWFRLFLLFFLV